MTSAQYGQQQYGQFSYGSRAGRVFSRTVAVSGDGASSATRGGLTKVRTPIVAINGTQDTVIANLVNVLSDGLRDRSVTFDDERGAFVTDWQYETQWTSNETFGVRIVSGVETDPIEVTVERDDTGDGTVDDTAQWRRVTATATPITFPEVSNGEAHYRILLRYVRPSDHVTNIDTGFVEP